MMNEVPEVMGRLEKLRLVSALAERPVGSLAPSTKWARAFALACVQTECSAAG